MSLILSCSFLFLSLGVVKGVATVVDLAKKPGLLVNNDPGFLEGSSLPEEVTDFTSSSSNDSVVVMAGVTPSLICVVPL